MARSTRATRDAMRGAAYAARQAACCGHTNGWHSCRFGTCTCTRPNTTTEV